MKASMKITTRTPAKNFFAVFKKEAHLQANKFMIKFAEELLEEAKQIIENQSFDWTPLSEEYKQYKETHGLDERIMIATRDFIDNGFDWWIKEGRIHFGPKQGTHKPSGLPYRVLAMIMEYGTETIPPRPLWRPLLSMALRKSKKFKDAYTKAVETAVKKAATARKTETRRS